MFNPLSLFRIPCRRRRLYPLLSILIAVVVGIASPQSGQALSIIDLILKGAPAIQQVIQLSNVSNQQEVEIGRQINQQLVSSNQIHLYNNPALTAYINHIGQRLARSSDRPNIPYTFQVVEDKSVNAFATMGGFVYVHTGLLAIADNEAQLASVLGHEIGHIGSRHALKQMRQKAIASGLVTAAGLNTNNAVQIGLELAIRRPKSRKDEFEADQKGLITLGKAGYPQSEMVAFMHKLLNANSSSIPGFLSDHPATQDRITALNHDIDPNRARVGDGLDMRGYKTKMHSFLGS